MSGANKRGDGKRTKKELISEIEERRAKLASAQRGSGNARQPTLGADISRRDALKVAWVTPVVLSVPLVGAGGRAGASPGEFTESSAVPTEVPPTVALTMNPTASPTTASPTVSPTNNEPAPAEPTLAPTAARRALDAPLLSGAGAAVVAGALFGVAAKKLSERESDDSEESED